MDAKEIKSALKEAREAIKNKDFAASVKICKSILKSDKENYMALVFFGISLQEVGPRDQAPLAFRKAILSSPDQILAWTGLANYYEKDESDTASKELIPVYEKLLDIESDASKVSDLCDKLVVRGVKVQEIEKCAEILKKLGNNEKCSENNRRTARVALVSLLLQGSDLSTELLITLEAALASLVKDRASVSVDYYKEYLKLLYKLKKYEVLFDEAVQMQSLYESNIYPLEWICKIYVELVIENNSTVSVFAGKMKQYCQKLSSLQDNATMVVFTQAVDAFKSGNFIEARDYVKKVVTARAGLTHAWVLLADCWLKLHCYDESLRTATHAEKLLQSMTKTNDNLRKKIDNMLMVSLSKHTDPEKWIQAIELCTKLLEQNADDVDTLVSLCISYINLGRYNDAKECMRQLKKSSDNTAIVALLTAKLLHKQGELETALALLKSADVESCELFMEMGMLHWELQQYDLSLVPFLKAAKLDANYYIVFIYLARYYEHCKDLEKARRCYQKAFKINPRCLEAGMELSNIYRQQKNWTANLELLQSVTGTNTVGGLHMIGADVRWAWLQLGLHYLEQSEYNDAIDCLRCVIRAEPDNGHYWECLADAYMSRGAYTAALKSYERSAELSENVTYPKLQAASIKLLLGNYAEAKLEFEEVLTENKRYVPALKGLAENCLNLAYDQHKEQFLGLSRDNAQYALDSLTQALKERNDLSCIWKLTGDSCALVASLPDKYCHMRVDSLLAEGEDGGKRVEFNRLQLYTLATRCYCKAISLAQTNILLWHDLAMCYYSHGCCVEDSSERKKLLSHALVTSKYCVAKSSDNWEHWNLLGIVAVHKDVKNYVLAQHAFIKAVTLENNSAVAWCNLGTLYFILADLRLANKAYSEAQRSDPDYVNCWVGQALIAERVGHEDAMDLFRHSTQLGHHSQGAIGYAQWVCRTVIEAPPRAILYSIHNMHAIPVACDAMTWYTENNPDNSCAWNLLGLLRERLGLKISSIDAFKKSMAMVEEKNHDKVLINCGRILVKVKEYDEAIQLYRQVKEASFNGGCSLALALFKAEQYPESYDSYDTTMQWLAQSENLQSHVLVALAAMAYMFQGQESAKNLLFQSTQLKPPSQWGLFATLSLGLLHGDFALAQLVLKELQPMKDDPDVLYHYSVLLSLTYLLQGDKKSAIRSLTKSVHRHPGQASLWLFLSIMLLLLDPRIKSRAADNCAQVSMKLGRSQMDVSKVLCIVSLATCVSKDAKKALCAAQRAVHCYPDVAENWAVLISALKMASDLKNKWHRHQEWVQMAKKHLNDNLNPSKNLATWLSTTNDN